MAKIIQITVLERKDGNTNIPKIFGLSEGGKVYEWQYDSGNWEPYQNLDSTASLT